MGDARRAGARAGAAARRRLALLAAALRPPAPSRGGCRRGARAGRAGRRRVWAAPGPLAAGAADRADGSVQNPDSGGWQHHQLPAGAVVFRDRGGRARLARTDIAGRSRRDPNHASASGATARAAAAREAARRLHRPVFPPGAVFAARGLCEGPPERGVLLHPVRDPAVAAARPEVGPRAAGALPAWSRPGWRSCSR